MSRIFEEIPSVNFALEFEKISKEKNLFNSNLITLSAQVYFIEFDTLFKLNDFF